MKFSDIRKTELKYAKTNTDKVIPEFNETSANPVIVHIGKYYNSSDSLFYNDTRSEFNLNPNYQGITESNHVEKDPE